MEIGAQMYTVRDHCRNLTDFAESLRKIAEIGYTNVQISGTCEYEPEWLAGELRRSGLKCVLTHIEEENLLRDPAAVAREHVLFGCQYVGLGMHRFPDGEEAQSFTQFVQSFTGVAGTLAEHGKYFMYHNHHYEFKWLNGRTILENLAEAFPEKQMGFILDTFWVQAGGADPAEWLTKLSGRVPCIHLKDFAYDRRYAVLGEGNMNFDRIFEKAEDAGTRYMLVEQDSCYDEDPFECLKRSYQYLRSYGFR